MPPTPQKAGASPPRVIAIDVESQGRPSGTPYRSGHHPRETYDGDSFPRPPLDFSEVGQLTNSMKVTFKVSTSETGVFHCFHT